MDKTTLYLPQDLHSALKSIAHRRGRSQAEIIREALSSYVALQDRPRPTSWGSGESDEIRGADAEEWLDAHWKPDW
jgi:predicted transcriptional regulator